MFTTFTVLNEDFMSVTGMARFEACQMISCVEVPIINDTISEEAEVFYVHLEQTPGLSNRISFQETEAAIKIVDLKGVL